jgi:hypothetical protein
MSLLAMALLWTGSQIPVYLYGSIPPYIYQDIGGADRWIWFVCCNYQTGRWKRTDLPPGARKPARPRWCLP